MNNHIFNQRRFRAFRRGNEAVNRAHTDNSATHLGDKYLPLIRRRQNQFQPLPLTAGVGDKILFDRKKFGEQICESRQV